ncbi:hypothetical protein MTO96_021849 [Rhipicephalus appendiculatus]
MSALAKCRRHRLVDSHRLSSTSILASELGARSAVHLTCLPCKATHEGVSCATFQAERRPAGRSPTRSPSPLGARRKSYGTTSPWKDARSIDGDKAPSRVSLPPTLAAELRCDDTANTSRTLLGKCLGERELGGSVTLPGTSRHSLHRRARFIISEVSLLSPFFAFSPRCVLQQSVVADRGTWSGDPGASRQMRKAICRTEDCGFEKQVDARDTELICYKCRKTTCLVCNAIHSYLTCEEYRRQDHVHSSAKLCTSSRPARPTRRSATVVGRTALQPREATPATMGGAGETYSEEEPTVQVSRGDKSESRDVPPVLRRLFQKHLSAEKHLRQEGSARSAGSEGYKQSSLQRNSLNQIFEEIVDVLGCGHLLCRECVHATAVGSLTYIVHCPVTTEEGVSCGSCIQESALISVMTEDEYTLRKGLLNLPIIRCPTEGCSGKFSARPGTQRMNCPACQSEYCVPCSAIHSGITCEQFIRGVVDDVDGPDVADILSSGLSASPLPSTPETSDEEAVECSGCLADTPAEDVVTVEQCGHRLCRDCIRRNTIEMTGNAALCPVKLEDDTQCNSRIQGSAL